MAESSAVPLQTSQAVSSAYDVEAGNDAPANKQNGVPCYKNVKYLTIIAVLAGVLLLVLVGVIVFLILRGSSESSTVAPSSTSSSPTTVAPFTLTSGSQDTTTGNSQSRTTENPSSTTASSKTGSSPTTTDPSLGQETMSGEIVSASGPIRGIKQDMSKEE